MSKKNFVSRMKQKWGITSNIDFILIMLVFSLAGMMVSVCRKPIFAFLWITRQTPLWVKVIVYIPLIIPLYQISLIIFGFLLGQFPFFWEKEKRLGKFFLQIFNRIRMKSAGN